MVPFFTRHLTTLRDRHNYEGLGVYTECVAVFGSQPDWVTLQ
jgi:hypothetical protein